TGKKVFFYRYKAPSKALREIKLGEFPPTGSMTLAAARKALAEAKTAREKGVDLQGAKQTSKAEAKADRAKRKVLGYTVGKMIDDYLVGHVVPMRKAKGAEEVTRFLNSDDLKAIRKRPAVEVTRNEAFNVITKIRNRGVPVLAGQIKAELKAAYEFAMNAGVIDMAGNPFAFVLRGVTAAKRERTLNDSELLSLVPWMQREYSEAVADALLITLYCGVRSGEVCTIEAHEVEDGANGMVWTIPVSKSKTKVPFNVMVPVQAAAILRKRLGMHSAGWLFPSRKIGKPIEQKVLGVEVWAHSPGCNHPHHRLKAKCPVGNWAPHDLRRTCRTVLSRLGCPVDVGETILNHTKGGVRGNYDHYKFDAEKREWLQRWADHIDNLVSAENVVPFEKRKAV
ncbi:MAG: tyrosine-type recombinase/integrase, partial [Methylomonas sp.]